MEQLSLILNEIASLGAMRVQGLFGFSQALVLELYAREHGRLYLICDYSPAHKSFHLQKKKPQGLKVITPLILLLKKYALGRGITFMRILYQPSSLLALIHAPRQDFSIVFELDSSYKIGLFNGSLLLASAKHGQAPHFSNAVVPTESCPSLVSNFEQAERYASCSAEQYYVATLRSYKEKIRLALKKKVILLQNLDSDLRKFQLNLSHEHDAQLIKANIHLIKRGMNQVALYDYSMEIPEQKIIMLDPRLSPQQYIEKIFHHLKRARRGLDHIKPRIAALKIEIAELKLALEKLDKGEIRPELIENTTALPAKPPLKPVKRLPYRVFMSSDNIPIWVGRSAKDNDALTLHHARGNEWWFHVRDGAGSHVVVKNSQDVLAPETLIEAAMLAAHFSTQKYNSNPEVCYTRIKFIRKPKGLPPGKVIIEQEKSLIVRMDQKRLTAICK